MLVGQELGPFLIEKELGAGAMGAVYLGREPKSKMRVAIKVMAPGLTSETALKRFQREASILKQLKHPNIVRLVGIGKHHGSPFYAMEFVEGESLDHAMARRDRLTWEEVVAFGKQLCAGLQHAHEKGIVHRDLKPSNLMVLRDGTVKLTDFGIAKDTDATQLTAANCTVGTAAYMSPEQCRGERELTFKSDLYSMGVMFYELLTGKKPFEAESIMDMFMQHNKGTFERPSRLVLDIPIWLDTLVCQLLEKSPDKRPFNAAKVAEALESIEEKVQAQQSAGIDAATARRIDRSAHSVKLDETDKDAARTLLNRKKKKKVIPFYRKGWFQAVALSGVLLVIGSFFYLVFIKAPSAESLYSQAQDLMKTNKREARRGPIADFLRYYPDHRDTATVRGWADAIDVAELDEGMYNRWSREWKIVGDAEKFYRQAREDEKAGKLKDAEKAWEKVQEYKNPQDSDEHAWHLLAQKSLKELKGVDDLYKSLQDKAAKLGDKEATGSPEEVLALEAIRAQKMDDLGMAKEKWEKLKRVTNEDPGRRTWYLLASRQHRELDTSKTAP